MESFVLIIDNYEARDESANIELPVSLAGAKCWNISDHRCSLLFIISGWYVGL